MAHLFTYGSLIYVWLTYLLMAHLFTYGSLITYGPFTYLLIYLSLTYLHTAHLFTCASHIMRLQRGLKGDNVHAIVRVEFGDKILGESGKVECSADNPSEINYTAHITFSSDDPLALDDLACKPLVCK